jgi:putative nucleotidyltransferase-like protein
MVTPLDGDDLILVTAAHPVLSPEREAQLTALLAGTVNWPVLMEHAQRHGIAPILYGHLRAMPTVPVPRDVTDTLGALARACVSSNLRLRHELGRLLAAFTRAGVAVMPLKGPVLADQLYPTPSLRPSSDLDVLVRAHAAGAAEHVLDALGYTRRPDEEQGADYHTIFTARGVDVELHRDLGERHASRLDVETIWSSATAASWHGHSIWCMSLSDQLVYLAFHAAKDGLASLRALVDIALLVDRHRDGLPWAALVARLRDAHLAPVVYLALSETRALLGAPVPDEFLDAIRPRYAGWSLAQRLFRWRGGVLHVPDDLLVGPFMAALMFLWEDTARARLRHVKRNLLPSARLRGRWTSSPAPVWWVIWYAMWGAHAARYLIRQLAARHPRQAARS